MSWNTGRAIQGVLEAKGQCSVDTLMLELGMSESAIRRNLRLLEGHGAVRRLDFGLWEYVPPGSC